MQTFKNSNFPHFVLLLTLFSSLSTIQPSPISSCGNIRIQNSSSLLTKSLICKSQNLYLRTTLGLFKVSSIDYKAKTLTIPHTSCSPSLHFISPSLLSFAFPSPPQSNSLLLFNCRDPSPVSTVSRFLDNCTSVFGCEGSHESSQAMKQRQPSSCWIVHDLEKLEVGFDPKDLNCSHYARVHKDVQYGSNSSSIVEGLKLGTVISFDVPDHIPNVCDECRKPHGDCGAGLRCICHPKECRDKVIARSSTSRPYYALMITPFLLFVLYL